MKKYALLILSILLCVGSAHADYCATQLNSTLGWAAAQQVCRVFGSGFAHYGNGTQGAVTPAVPVFVSTPVAGTNVLSPGYNVVPATVTANTAAFIGGSTPIQGQEFEVYNSAPSTVRLKAPSGATLNGATANGYITVAGLSHARCFINASSNVVCTASALPTPQGP